MVYIRKLEIYGFKSFGFKNYVLNFEQGLTAVTGPNGSGKSNILDAIIFAIGENSPKSLRIDKLSSLFHDSQSNSGNLIRISLTFDNTDRGIPIDSNNVTLVREMERQTSDSQYYINGKKVLKTTMMDLLEIVVATPNKLNIVQQGMITRISELNSEERKTIIEDIVGLSYFDEKKAESLKQLEESDRRLEIALAKMGEIRNRIDELEEERNDQLRYRQLESDLKRFQAIMISNTIRSIRNKLESQNASLDTSDLNLSGLSKEMEEINSNIEKLDCEKIKFIQEVDVSNKNKAQIGTRITTIVYESERMKAMLKESEHRILDIEKLIPTLDIEKQHLNQKLGNLHSQSEQNEIIINEKSNKVLSLKTELENINIRLDNLTIKHTQNTKLKERLEERYKRLFIIKNTIDISIARLEEKIKITLERVQVNDSKIFSLKNQIDNSNTLLSDLRNIEDSEKSNLDKLYDQINKYEERKNNLENELTNSSNLFSKADNLATQYETRVTVVRNFMNEDLAIAELMKCPEKFGIKGLVHNVISWDKRYERPLFAAGSEWMKAFIVNDIKSMILIAEYAKLEKLPNMKIISLDIASHAKRFAVPDDVNIIGNLADFVNSDFEKLPYLLFGNTFLVKTPTDAYMLAKKGYRAVSVGGELFEPLAGSMSLDFGSKISDLTRTILLSDSVSNFRDSIIVLKTLINNKTSDLKEISLKIKHSESEKIKIETKISNVSNQMFTILKSVDQAEKIMHQLIAENAFAQSEANSLRLDLEKCHKRMSVLIPAIKRVMDAISNHDDEDRNELTQMSMQKNQILKSIEGIDFEVRQTTTSLVKLNSEVELSVDRIKSIDYEKKQLQNELIQRRGKANELHIKLDSIEAELMLLRDQEQKIIDSAGTSYSVLQQYEQKIKLLTEKERILSRSYNAIERESAILRKDISDLASRESRYFNDLNSLGYDDLLEEFDIDAVNKELTNEYEAMKSRINLRASESYDQLIEGYRSMSSRKNELETERNSIVLFVEEISKEKKNVFMDAFNKVDNSIRTTFSELTGGAAWLELENTEDIFSSGILFMVKLPGKPERESTALSGGEKTMASIVFLLALQQLKPSPFYLMDEVDAHLDAQNTERLSKVLLQRSKGNQIIMVTLKDSTVAMADLIYGVYSKEGISRLVKYSNNNQVPLAEVKSNMNPI